MPPKARPAKRAMLRPPSGKKKDHTRLYRFLVEDRVRMAGHV
jgi:hypothetical protein